MKLAEISEDLGEAMDSLEITQDMLRLQDRGI
jgi:hypothetical protein